MPDTYTIYLENESAEPQTFWCFLAPPEELANDDGVFANSGLSLTVAPGSRAIEAFGIRVEYVVGAGASNHPVGPNEAIVSDVTKEASLRDTWNATYATAPPEAGPSMAKAATPAPPNAIAIVSNAFDRVSNENRGWFSSQTFGIETQQGFVGMSWSPMPQRTRTITPRLAFYVAVGDYSSNALAIWYDVYGYSAVIEAPGNFELNECTVTFTEVGAWMVTPGRPPWLSTA
ncbi:MAG: hypothetical protein QOD42_1003 [Sphingomonadales bacterium]|nr:hypothetical protein [Sphingomonadales bacterium]